MAIKNNTFEIINSNEINVCGITTKLTKSQGKNFIIIKNHWFKFNKALRQNRVSLGSSWKKYGITYKNGSDYYYMCAIEAKKSIRGFTKLTINSGEYSLFKHTGAMIHIKDTLYKIYKETIPEKNLDIDTNRSFIHYELYDYRFNWNDDNSTIFIYVPLIKRQLTLF